jgi:murein DD-endopeptidase MepM/ murein hydrolase activator NlpD
MGQFGTSPFHPTVVFDGPYWVHDFTQPQAEGWEAPFVYSVGRYDEHRPSMYTTALFEGVRDHHVGLDLGAPAGTSVYAFGPGEVFAVAINDDEGSYGPTLITHHRLALPANVGEAPSTEVTEFWVLYGHLSWDSISHWTVGEAFEAGAVLARLGEETENGGWPPHVHVQMSLSAPVGGDLPGVVAAEDRLIALTAYPDPRLICGPLY